ncbi:MAG TPA: hypothetical protein PL105_09285 [Caldilineaceae bacterium]|nr:hypothetical protein [Caldilineaceae bacterium]
MVRQVEDWAGALGQSPQDVVENALQSYLDEMEAESIRQETEAFWSIHKELLTTYAGLHIAIYHKQVIDSDRDANKLTRRIEKRFGRLPVLIAPVVRGQRRDILWRGGRIE